MPNDSDVAVVKDPAQIERTKKAGYMERYNEPGRFGFPKGDLVEPGRVKVRAKAPKEETTSFSTSGGIRTPDTSPIGPMINDKGQ